MLRDYITISNKPVLVTYKADAACKTGMGVVLDDTNGEFAFPTAATADEIYFVDKERIPTGTNAAISEHSDYDSEFIDVKVGELAKLVKYLPGEEFLTDQIAASQTNGTVLVVGTDGKLTAATSTTTSRYYLVKKDFSDNGHTLARIRVLEIPIVNA
ncbi:MAG: hypothetical protein M0P00_10940 [Bacteroidaceae bacterium]|nr:hypothetical protein [Bacteroidaceae bacterium]